MINKELLQTIRQNIKNKPHNNYWNIEPEIGQFLYNLVIAKNAQTIVEIGTSNGYSGTWFAEAAAQTGGHVYTIESHAARFAEAQEHFKQAELTEVITQLKGHAPEIFTDNFPEIKIDIAFLDATKKEYGSYFSGLLGRMTESGIFLADNVTSHFPAMKNFFTAIHSHPEYQAYYAEDLGTGLILVTKQKTDQQLVESLHSAKWLPFKHQ